MKISYFSTLNFQDVPAYEWCLRHIVNRVKYTSTEIVIKGRGYAAQGLTNSEVIGSPTVNCR